MYLIVGLGNPGRQYEATRHNMGFDVIDKLVEEYQVPQGGVKFNAMYGKGIIGGQPALLMKPLSYMNLSGGPVREMANYFKIDPETEMIVIYDDIDLDPGQIRIRKTVSYTHLGRFGKEDRKLVDEAQERACKAVELILSDGPDAAMNEYNKKLEVV